MQGKRYLITFALAFKGRSPYSYFQFHDKIAIKGNPWPNNWTKTVSPY